MGPGCQRQRERFTGGRTGDTWARPVRERKSARGAAGGAADKRACRVSRGRAPRAGGPGRGAGRSETGRALTALSARRWAERGKGGVSWAAGMIRAAVWVGPERRGKAGPVWEKGSGQLGCVAKLGWIGFGSWFSFLFSIQILKPTNKQRFEFKYKFEFKPHSNN